VWRGSGGASSRFDIALLKRRRRDNVARNANRVAQLVTQGSSPLPDISYTKCRNQNEVLRVFATILGKRLPDIVLVIGQM